MGAKGINKGRSSQGLESKIARLRAGPKQYELAAKVGIASTQLCEILEGLEYRAEQ